MERPISDSADSKDIPFAQILRTAVGPLLELTFAALPDGVWGNGCVAFKFIRNHAAPTHMTKCNAESDARIPGPSATVIAADKNIVRKAVSHETHTDFPAVAGGSRRFGGWSANVETAGSHVPADW